MTTPVHAEDPRQAHAQHLYEPQHEPYERWESWKFGLDRESVVNELWDQYNTIKIPILGFRQFMLDVRDVSAVSETREDLETRLAERRRRRVHELQTAMDAACRSILENPMRARDILSSGQGLRTDGDQAISDIIDCIDPGSPDLASLATFFCNLAHSAQTNAHATVRPSPNETKPNQQTSQQPSQQPLSPCSSPLVSTLPATVPTPTTTETNVPSFVALPHNQSPVTTPTPTTDELPTSLSENPKIPSPGSNAASNDEEASRPYRVKEVDTDDPYPAKPLLYGPDTWDTQFPGDKFSYYERDMCSQFSPITEEEREGHAVEVTSERQPKISSPVSIPASSEKDSRKRRRSHETEEVNMDDPYPAKRVLRDVQPSRPYPERGEGGPRC